MALETDRETERRMMTDRIDGCWVAFDKDYRDDDLEPILHALRMIRGVAAVEPHVVAPMKFLAESQVRQEVARKLVEISRDLISFKHQGE
jgi:hypothetical protein